MSHFASNEVVLLVRYTTRKMIRQLAILAVAAVCLAVPTNAEATTPETDVVSQQKLVANLISHIYENVPLNAEVQQLVQNLDIEAHMDTYPSDWKDAILQFLARYKRGMLPPGRIFSVYYPYQLEESVLLYKVFYLAPTLLDLVKTIYWVHANLHVNEHQFYYALSTAFIHRRDTTWLPMIPPYQVYPEFFVNTDVIGQIYDYKVGLVSGEQTESEHVVIPANYTNWYVSDTMDYEYNLTYFTEDIDLNVFYYNFNMRYPFWMSSKQFSSMLNEKSGETYYFFHKMLLNRYQMERLSHNLDTNDFIDWQRPIRTGYSPNMIYQNGLHFPRRPELSTIPIWKNEYLQLLMDIESRIAKTADSGYMLTFDGKIVDIHSDEGFNIFADLVQGNNNSLNRDYYGSIDRLSRHTLGYSSKPYNHYQILPSALEHFSTSMRDPVFYQMYKRILSYFGRYKERLGAYTPMDLAFEGVRIESFSLSEPRLITYMEPVYTVINKFWNTLNKKMTIIKVRQNRLNYKTFTYNLNIDSDKQVKASVRIFIAPKYNIYGKEITHNSTHFVEMANFVVDLKQGANLIVRNSTENPFIASNDCPTVETFDRVIEGDEQAAIYKCRFGFPAHLILPRGKAEGMPVQFFAYVSEFVQDAQQSSTSFLVERDNKPLGFPLDRPMFNFNMANMYLLDINIYHVDEYRTNLSTQ